MGDFVFFFSYFFRISGVQGFWALYHPRGIVFLEEDGAFNKLS